MLEPIILPKLLIYFADFPYLGCITHWATHPWVLLQFGTTSSFLFTRLVSLLLSMTLHRSTVRQVDTTPLPAVVIILLLQSHHMNISMSPFYIGSYHLLQSKGWTRLNVLIIIATTSKICSEAPSTHSLPCPSPQASCQSTKSRSRTADNHLQF